MITLDDLKDFTDGFDYDLRKSNNGRWIDQKCTPDVISIIADCIVNYNYDANNFVEFSARDIWQYRYAEENIRDIFNKPRTTEVVSKNEYDKFFSQPLEMLANAKILNKFKRGNRNIYTVNNIDILEYISLRERNALNFIIIYCKKVLKDSGVWDKFEIFFMNQTPESFYKVKSEYQDFIIANTPIKGELEARRIFTKVINPLAFEKRKKGTMRGRLSQHPINYSELMYNRENFRDVNQEKPKEMSRQEWNKTRSKGKNLSYYKYQSQKAKKFLRKYNDQFRAGKSEVADKYSNGYATQIHHIFPESQFPSISMYLENLIALTPTQHFNKAHPNNNTYVIDPDYQEQLLRAKAYTIEENIQNDEVDTIYSFDSFVEVINEGFATEYEVEYSDYSYVMNILSTHNQ